MASRLIQVASVPNKSNVRFHGNRKNKDGQGYRVVNQRLNTTVLQSVTNGRVTTVSKGERVFAV